MRFPMFSLRVAPLLIRFLTLNIGFLIGLLGMHLGTPTLRGNFQCEMEFSLKRFFFCAWLRKITRL